MSYIFRVSKPGYDITDTNIQHIAFDSDINCFKIDKKDVANFNTTDVSWSFAHNLGYIPAFIGFFEVAGNGRWYPLGTKEDYSGKNIRITGRTNNADIIFEVTCDDDALVKVYYALIVDPLQT
jgi:hypothetical protein